MADSPNISEMELIDHEVLAFRQQFEGRSPLDEII